MTEVKRGRGRPRKVVEPEAPKNPDCEPATKGFVKCIARTVVNESVKHTHPFGRDLLSENLCAVSLLGVFGFGLVAICEYGALNIHGWFPTCVLGFLISVGITGATIVTSEQTERGGQTWRGEYQWGHPIPQIQKYEPPCEKKKECGDD